MTVIDGIPATRKRPRAGLLTVASLLPSGTDWRQGVTYVPEGCRAPEAFPICEPGAEKPESVTQDAVEFKPFGVVNTDGCNDPWMTNQEFLERAERTLAMGQSAILARELLQSTVTTNPDLQGTAVDLTALMPVPAPVGWGEAATALLYNMMNAGYVGDVWIHAPSWLLPSFNESGVGDIDPATRQAYIGPHPVIFDAGYSGLIGPGGAAGLADPSVAGWVYASGPVEYAWDTLVNDGGTKAADPQLNNRFVVAERPGIVRFDPCQVFGILVEVCK
jgi:hypothetical protein